MIFQRYCPPFPSLLRTAGCAGSVLWLSFASSILSPAANAEPLKAFTDPREAISEARDHDQLLIFVLLKQLSEESDKVAKILDDELTVADQEFVIVKCSDSDLAHRKLFEEKFQKDPDEAPLVVVTDATGATIASAVGTDPEDYQKMIDFSRVKSGKETDPEVIAEFTEEGSGELMTDSVFGLRKGDVSTQMVLLTEMRDWTFANGTTFRGALLSANGPTGVFVKEKTFEKQEINFNELSKLDQQYLQLALNQ